MSPLFEFEDIVGQLDSVDLIAPATNSYFRAGNRVSIFMGNKLKFTTSLGTESVGLDRDYDLFVAVCHHPDDILILESIKRWRDCAKTSICLLVELWPKDIDLFKGSMQMLDNFDHVILNHSTSVDLVREFLGEKSSYLPFAIDAQLFCPYPALPERVIDFLSIGRRSEATHKSLLNEASDGDFFYVYDSLKGSNIFDPKEHRFLYASMAKRSRFFMVNPGKIDMAPEAGYPSEFGPRYFEGAAAGCILIGETARNEQFEKTFHWPDAVVRLPYGSSDVADVIADFASDPGRVERVRRTNMAQMLLHHDWAYRWESILALAKLEPSPELERRKADLKTAANAIIGQTAV